MSELARAIRLQARYQYSLSLLPPSWRRYLSRAMIAREG